MDNFSFLLPINYLVFGAAFVIIWRYGSRTALWWAAGFLFQAVAFGGEFVFAALPGDWRALAVDTLFILGLVCHSRGLSVHFGRPRRPWLIGGVALAGFLLVAAAIRADSMPLELLAIDTTCTLLLLLPLVGLRRLPALPAHRVLMGVAIATALIIFVNALAYAVFDRSGLGFEDYHASSYAFASQILSMLTGTTFALAALASAALDVIQDYRIAAESDPLTGLLNRRGFERAMERAEVASTCQAVSCDIDRFKAINDVFGHDTGDQVIVALAETLTRHLPPGGVVARFGGEEFVACLPGAGAGAALAFAEATRRSFATLAGERLGQPVSASFGVAGWRSDDLSFNDVLRRADAALYRAKAGGRDRVSLEPAVQAA